MHIVKDTDHLHRLTRLIFNCFLLREDDGSATLIDTGLPGSAPAILVFARRCKACQSSLAPKKHLFSLEIARVTAAHRAKGRLASSKREHGPLISCKTEKWWDRCRPFSVQVILRDTQRSSTCVTAPCSPAIPSPPKWAWSPPASSNFTFRCPGGSPGTYRRPQRVLAGFATCVQPDWRLVTEKHWKTRARRWDEPRAWPCGKQRSLCQPHNCLANAPAGIVLRTFVRRDKLKPQTFNGDGVRHNCPATYSRR
jgi:hypothetical protein